MDRLAKAKLHFSNFLRTNDIQECREATEILDEMIDQGEDEDKAREERSEINQVIEEKMKEMAKKYDMEDYKPNDEAWVKSAESVFAPEDMIRFHEYGGIIGLP
jgi:hypothetical protein